MPISIDQWSAAIGLFGARRYASVIKKRIFFSTIIFLPLVQHGDIENNPGP